MLSDKEAKAIIGVWKSYKDLEEEYRKGPLVNEDYANMIRLCRKAIEAVCFEMGYAIGAGPIKGFFLCRLEEAKRKRQEGSWFYGRTDIEIQGVLSDD